MSHWSVEGQYHYWCSSENLGGPTACCEQFSKYTPCMMCRTVQVDPDVSAAYYFNKSLLHKQQKNFAEFYKSSLLYLAFISSDALPQDVKLVSWKFNTIRF